jgi:hypothetical protein
MPTADIPLDDLQAKLYTRLDAALTASVYDNVPENASYPYVTIGEAIATPDNAHDRFGWDILETVHVWTRARGYKSGLAIANTIIATLDHKRSIIDLGDPWHCVSIRFEQLLTLRDPDPEIRHIPVQFRIGIEQEG